ncbi:hypothetical protein PGT21_023728 [Puccinia graminis f. sp. tritici]|uniref:VWFA domain-containing protein n=1 Tax=Puccinia graminis f. sp. tritici TaxID=56615 RepID=A0A5B0MLN0_PUCGR|nr:hypothetical protein PGT21_023728 [Puccinia graminis f. sp. tritici]KAA1078885.1 hypothetical protein PGTUg99_015569 [Puccinia graminis f. sp. tritici]
MAGMISAFVELPGASNHEDFKFPWSLDEINHLVSDRKANRQKKTTSHDVQDEFQESGLREDFGKQVAPGAPEAQSKYYSQAPRPSTTNPNPGGPTQEPNSSLKNSFKYVTGLVKQKIVSLEEKAALLNYVESPNAIGQSKTSPASSSNRTQMKKPPVRSTERKEEPVHFHAENHKPNNYSYSESQNLERLSERYENPEAYQSAPGPSTLPPGYYQNSDAMPAQESLRTPEKKVAKEAAKIKSKRKDATRKAQPNQPGTEKADSSMPKDLRENAEETRRMEESSSHRPPTGSKTKMKASESKARTPTLGANDFQIHGDENLLSTLKRFKTIFLLDDSASMASNGHWEKAISLLAELVKEASHYDTEGIDLQFLNSNTHFKNIKGPSSLLRKFKSIQPTGDSTPTETKVEELLRPYIEILEMQKSRNQPLSKPLNLVIITDGIPDDIDSFISIISHVSSKLDAGHFPLNQVGIQFVQIGDEKRVSRVLKILDNHLQKRYGVSRDMIDTTQFSGITDQAFIVKCLLGGINRRVDRMQVPSS